MKKPTITITQDEAEVMLEWATSGKQADLDAYDGGQGPYYCTRRECKRIWDGLIKKLKKVSRNK